MNRIELNRAAGGRRSAAATAVLAMVFLLALPAAAAGQSGRSAQSDADRLRRLEEEVAALRAELTALRAEKAEAAEAAAEGVTPESDALGELARRLDVLAAEIENLKLGEAAAEADRAERGLGPAASKVYRTGQGLSIGGYGEMLYQRFDDRRDDGATSGRTDQLDFLRAVVYVGYKFNDRFLFNSEIEFEHAATGEEGEVSAEFAYLDYLWLPGLNARAGLVLVPMGLVNELHEPTVFLGARRPDVERVILPTTWRENGIGLFGDVGPWSYRTYLVNGFDASGFSAAGLRGGRQKGSEAAAEDFAWVGRLDWQGVPGLLVGGSLYGGGADQGLTRLDGRPLDVTVSIAEAHLDWRRRGFQLRALAARAEVDGAAELNLALGLGGAGGIGEALEGGYVEVAYDLLARRGKEWSLRPYLRWESYDTQAEVPAGFRRDPARDVESFTLGLAFQPLDELIVKTDYQDYDNGAGTGVDQVSVAIGYVF